jgi:hypothetical protein
MLGNWPRGVAQGFHIYISNVDARFVLPTRRDCEAGQDSVVVLLAILWPPPIYMATAQKA